MQDIVGAVKAELQGYADRGVFRNFSISESTTGKAVEFRFQWLAESAFILKLNSEKPELQLRNVLPAVPFPSEMDTAFRNFLIQRCDESIPAHRRLDGGRFSFVCRNRQQMLSVVIGFAPEDAAAAANSSIKLLHEIFNNFLHEGPYQNYMVEVFNVSEE